MKAVIHRAYGPPDEVLELRDVESPAVGTTDVLVDVHAAGVTGDDGPMVRGEPFAARLAGGLLRPRHRIPGRELAGRVAQVGASVGGLRPGDEVFGWCAGAFAERVAVPAANLARKPVRLTFAQAAAVPVAGTVALRAVRDGGVRSGDRVLVIGASGGVGTFVVQIAKAFGAHVTGVCSTTNTDLVRSIGADHVIDYTLEDCTVDGSRYDVVVDLAGARSVRSLRRTLSATGRLVLVAGSNQPWRHRSPKVVGALRPAASPAPADCGADLAALRRLVDDQRLIPVVSAHFALAEVPAALRHFAPGHARGQVVITM